MKKSFLLWAFFALCILFSLYSHASRLLIESSLPVEHLDSGYIVTVKSDFSFLQGQAHLFGESIIPSHYDSEQAVEFIAENIDSATPLISEIGMMKVDNKETLDELIGLGLVESYEPNIKLYLLGYDYSQNPNFSHQWGHTAVKSSYAWNAGVFGNGVRVAVIDSGVYPHNDLSHCLATGYNYIYNNTDTTDNVGHGTFVSGIISAGCNNIATVGLAHNATIVPLKVTDDKSFYLDITIQAIRDAVDIYDCDVINLSFGTTSNSTQLQSAISYAVSKGALVVAAAGNGVEYKVTDEYGNVTSTYDYECYIYPAAYDIVISVGNVQKTSESYIIRSTSTHNDRLDIASPGTLVYSLSNTANGYTTDSGTSYACPYVSAAAALAKSLNPTLTQAAFNIILKKTADSSYITENQDSDYWGYGLLDVEKMVKFILSDMYDQLYISPVDTGYGGKSTSVYITNLTNTSVNFGNIILYNHTLNTYGKSVLDKVKVIPVNLGIDESLEIPFTSLGMFGKVKYTMLSDKLKPLFPEVRTVTVAEN